MLPVLVMTRVLNVLSARRDHRGNPGICWRIWQRIALSGGISKPLVSDHRLREPSRQPEASRSRGIGGPWDRLAHPMDDHFLGLRILSLVLERRPKVPRSLRGPRLRHQLGECSRPMTGAPPVHEVDIPRAGG